MFLDERKKGLLNFVFLLLLLMISTSLKAEEYPVNLKQIHGYFEEIKNYCDADDGKLWGYNLWAPILVIDRESRFIVANETDNQGHLRKEGKVYVGYFPKNKTIANSTTEFGGKRWMMVMHPLYENDYNRNRLCIHELFHWLQPQLGLDLGGYNNEHMDKMDARILLKLEWLALEKAIQESDNIKNNLKNALIFRNYRRSLFPEKKSAENKFEIHEGLAEYTGHKICSQSNQEFKKHLFQLKDRCWDMKSYVRSFAYYSGVLYGYVLDQSDIKWANKIGPESDLGEMTGKIYKIDLPADLEQSYQKIRDNYNYDEIYSFEKNRELEQQAKLKEYRNKFLNNSVLILQVENPKVAFDPRNLIPMDSLGTVYPTIQIISDFGTLKVNRGGCLFDWKKAIISAEDIKKEESRIVGNGWILDLNPDYHLEKIQGDYRLIKE